MDVCLSGGADGADLAWGKAAKAAGHQVKHFLFKDHKGSRHPDAVIVTPEELMVGDNTLKLANQVLKRSFPAHSQFVTNLLRRNYWQVHDSERVYAIAGIDRETQTVIGGTSWAVECFKILHPDSDEIYIYDSWNDQWWQWNIIGVWAQIVFPPRPHGRWTGIGTRDLDAKGVEMINRLFE